ncbi:hypothetical protein [Methylobacterium hispanicum]
MSDDRRPVFPPAPRRASEPPPLPPVRYPPNPSPWARLGLWLFDRLTRR